MARLLRAEEAHNVKPSSAELAGAALKVLAVKGYLNVPKLADLLEVHKYTVREYIDKGLIQAFTITDRYYVDEAEINRIRELMQIHGGLAKAFHATKPSQRSNEDDVYT